MRLVVDFGRGTSNANILYAVPVGALWNRICTGSVTNKLRMYVSRVDSSGPAAMRSDGMRSIQTEEDEM